MCLNDLKFIFNAHTETSTFSCVCVCVCVCVCSGHEQMTCLVLFSGDSTILQARAVSGNLSSSPEGYDWNDLSDPLSSNTSG